MAKTHQNLTDLAKVAFSNEDAAVELMTQLRWPSGVACPKCGGADPYKLTPKAQPGRPARKGLYKCRACRKQFSVTTGSVFEATHVPLSKWLMAIHLMSASKKGMSAHQLHRMLGITYKAAWFINHRLRFAMAANMGLFTKLSGTVEVDETYVGGRRRLGPTNKEDREKLKTGRPGPKDKKLTPVVALVERGGRMAMFPVDRVTGATLQSEIRKRVDLKANMVTDELHAYDGLSMGFASHKTIKHSAKEYVRGDVHTNTVEGVFSLLKRGITGSFHHVSKGHLHRYCDEFSFRYNTRTKLGYTDSMRAAELVLGAEGKRLTYQSRSGASAA
jgi:transposase-like protein